MKKKFFMFFLTFLLILPNLSILSAAEGYVNYPEEILYESDENSIQPLYDIIHSVEMYYTEEKVAAILEAVNDYSLRITITLYQEKGSGWSFLAKKTFSDHSSALLGELYYDFQPGVTYRAVVNFNAGGETDSMEDIFSF